MHSFTIYQQYHNDKWYTFYRTQKKNHHSVLIKHKIYHIIYIIMWSCPGNNAKILPWSERHITWPKRVICLSDLGNILAYYQDKTTLISLLYWVSNCPGNMPKYYQYQISLQKLSYTKYNNCIYNKVSNCGT